jgi:hypothetical protein
VLIVLCFAIGDLQVSEQGFRGVPGVPDGWELVGFWRAKKGEHYIDGDGRAVQANTDLYAVWPIIRKIEQPAKYRPFADAEEFTPHRDRWWTWKDDRSNTFPPAAYGRLGHHIQSWEDSFDRKVFDDGTTFGVKLDG